MKFPRWLLLERDYGHPLGPHWQVYDRGALVFEGSKEEADAYVEEHRAKNHPRPVVRSMQP